MTEDRSATVARRLSALPRALSRRPSIGPWAAGPTLGLAAGFAAALVVDAFLGLGLGAPLRQLLAIGAFVLVAAPVWLIVEPMRARRAREVLTWLNGWETERWQREAGRRFPGVPRAHPGLLDRLPDTLALRPLRVELLATRGRFDEARERLAALPLDTPWQRFEHAALAEYVAFCSEAPAEVDDMRRAAADVDDERRAAAEAMVAAAEARRAAVAGNDPALPLAALRAGLGDRPARYGFGQTIGTVMVVVAIGIVAGLAVTATTAVLRP